MNFIANSSINQLIDIAIAEDCGIGDLTTSAIIDSQIQGIAKIIAREKLIVCGNEIGKLVFKKIDPKIEYFAHQHDGTCIEKNAVIAEISGNLSSILIGERTALNFMQRLSGVATKTAHFVRLVYPHKIKILDTRKTTPGFRLLERYAVKIGGGENHRFGLYDAVLIKNNHIDFLGGDIVKAVSLCKIKTNSKVKISVEVRNKKELENAIKSRPDSILLDNMMPKEIADCVAIVKKECSKVEIEISGGINEANIKEYAATGADAISIGALTHSVKSSDISLRIVAV